MAISLVGSANVGHSAASATLSIPDVSGVAVDDYALVFISTNGATIADQNGWQVLKNETFPAAVAHNLVCLRKRLNATDVSDTSFDFTASASNVMQGGIIVFRGVDLTTAVPTSWWSSADGDVDATAAFNAPSVTTNQDGAMIVRGYTYFYGSGTWDGDAISAASGTEAFEIAAGGALIKRPVAVYYASQATAGATGTLAFTQETTGVHAAFTVALRPDTGATEEGLAPTSIRNLTGLTGAVTAIDDDPDAGGTDFLTGTDPSSTTGATNGPEYPDSTAGATGQTAFAWNTPANITDASDTTFATEPSASTAKADYLRFNTADWSDIPSTATITGISYEIKHRAGTANRVTIFLQLGTANGSLIGTEVQVGGGNIATTAGGVIHTGSYSGTMPTRAEMVNNTFGTRLRMARSNTSTYDLYSVKITATYDVPGVTTNTSVEVLMADPTATLATGAGTGEIRIQARKLGNGADPTLRAEIHENASATVLDTPLPDSVVSNTTTTGQVLSGIFDQSVITNPANVEVWLIGTATAGALVEIGAVKWYASESVAAAQSTSVTGRATGERSGDQTSAVQANLATSATGRATGERSGDQSSAVQANQSTSVAGRASGERAGDHTSTTQASQSTSVAGRDSGERGGAHTSAVATVPQSTSVTGRATDERGGDATSAVQANLATAATGRDTAERGGTQTSALQASQATSVVGRATGERSGVHSSAVATTPLSTSVAGRDTGERGGSASSSVQASLATHAKRALVLSDEEYLGEGFVLGGGIGYVEPVSASGAAPSTTVAAGASLTTSVTGRASSERSGSPGSSVQTNQATSVTGRATSERGGAQSSAQQTNQATSVVGRATGERGGAHTSALATAAQTTTVVGRATDERTGLPGSALQAGMSTSVVGKNESGASGVLPTTVFSVPQVVRPTVVVTLETVPTAAVTLETVPKATVTLETVPTVSVTMETGPRAIIDLETVPMALVTVE